MELDPTLRAIILVVVMVGLGLVIYFELRYMRKRKKPKIDAQLIKDEAYNSLVTTRAVARVLDERGRDTSRAEQLLFQAENAYSRGEYARTKQLANGAKSELERSSEKGEPDKVDDSAEMTPTDSDEEGSDLMENKTLFEEEKKLPENYMQAKFMIKKVKREMEMARKSPMDISEAEKNLRSALEYFDRGRYTEALGFACKAEKGISFNITQLIGEESPSDADMEEGIEDAIEEIVEEEVSDTIEALVCRECGSPLEEGDLFCSQCGTKVDRRCPSCGSLLMDGDIFCRKCGDRSQ